MVYAFIDSQNLNRGISEQGWRLDFARFFVYLKDQYKVEKAFLFIGYVPANTKLYRVLEDAGYVLVFKPTIEFTESGSKQIKGNVDAELVLHTMIQFSNFSKAILVTGDGDYHCLIEYLVKKRKLLGVIIPNRRKYSALFQNFYTYLIFPSALRSKLEYKK